MKAEPPRGAGKSVFLDLAFDRVCLDAALGWIVGRGRDAPFAYVVTPNVDHMVRFATLAGAPAEAYRQADLCLCDSRILARLARLAGVDLEVVPGSDLTAALFARGSVPGACVCLIGGTATHGDLLRARYPHIAIVQHVPPMGLLHDAAARAEAIAFAAATRADVTLLAVGSPQQELLAYEMRRHGGIGGTGLCIGASVDFLVGAEVRAPAAIQRAGLEWAWRLLRNPRRLARRYLVEGPAIFPMVWRWSRQRKV